MSVEPTADGSVLPTTPNPSAALQLHPHPPRLVPQSASVSASVSIASIAAGSVSSPTDSRTGAEAEDGPPRKKPKQKRNKPTLSCLECVERKTKCDRGRPACLACIKRQSACRYSEVANLIATADRNSVRSISKAKNQVKPPRGVIANHGGVPQVASSRFDYRSSSSSSTASSPFLLSNIPNSKHTPSQVFGFGSQHPFSNYWTNAGGLPEVIGVLPSKEQADILVNRYFEAVDPVYPMIHKRSFILEYENFWSLLLEEKQASDPSLLALHFVIYAMGTQFMPVPSDHERAQIAEFYVSAAHQALRISSYLSRPNLRTIQAMILISYFLMNDNHASDAWAFAGVLIRQAYAIGLNRDPENMVPAASLTEKHQRRKVWQAVMFQDTFLTVLLKLPPTATFSDIRVESLTDEMEALEEQPGSPPIVSSHNPMSIHSIAPSPYYSMPHELSDRQYIRSMWHMANLVQTTVCHPRALSNPLTRSPAEKQNLLNRFRSLFASCPASLTTSDHITIVHHAVSNPRLARQNLFFRNNYWHCVMIVEADENAQAGVTINTRGALEAARMAINAFFEFWEVLRADVAVWWVFQHRAFDEALMMARLVTMHHQMPPSRDERGNDLESLCLLAKADIKKTLDILEVVGSTSPEMQKTRTDVLRNAYEEIPF